MLTFRLCYIRRSLPMKKKSGRWLVPTTACLFMIPQPGGGGGGRPARRRGGSVGLPLAPCK